LGKYHFHTILPQVGSNSKGLTNQRNKISTIIINNVLVFSILNDFTSTSHPSLRRSIRYDGRLSGTSDRQIKINEDDICHQDEIGQMISLAPEEHQGDLGARFGTQ